MRKTLYAIVGRKMNRVGKGRKKREVLGKEHIIYAEAPGSGGGCECSWTERVLWLFPTKKEALEYIQYPPYQYQSKNCRVIRLETNYDCCI